MNNGVAELMITLHVEPNVSYSWEMFVKTLPPFSIALDGFVASETRRDLSGPFANFDHHAHVDRLVSRSTCEQTHIEINLGLFDVFRKDGIPTANICINDCDEDTCLAVWLLLNHEQVVGHAAPAINRLVYCEDRMDSTGGGYPLGEQKITRKMAWMFEPYNRARFSGTLKNLDSSGMRTIVEAVCSRINRYVIDGGEELALKGEYERINGGSDWALVKETGSAARQAMYLDGIHTFVSIVGRIGKNNVYSIGRRSAWTKFNFKRIMNALNEEEFLRWGATRTATEKDSYRGWGPVDENATIGGSPREWGSLLTPADVVKIVEANKD